MASLMFRSVDHEQEEPLEANISGSIPGWLRGSLIRNGPGKYEVGDTKYNHFFDGLAKVHKFSINNGKVTYRSRFVQSETYKRNMAANRIVVTEFGTLAHPDPCKSLFGRIQSHFKILPDATDNTSVNVYPIGDQLYTASETSVIHRVDKETLATMDSLNLEQLVSVNMATAHPHIEPDGTIYNTGSFQKEGKYAIIKIVPISNGKIDAPVEKAEVLATIPARWKMKPSYHHSFAITENYIILVESPLVMNVMKLLTAKMRGKAIVSALEWNPQHPSIFYIINKKTGERVNATHKYTTPSFFTFHHANAYESGGNLVVDVCAFKDGNIISNVNRETMQNHEYLQSLPAAQPRRYVLPLDITGASLGENMLKSDFGKATASLEKDNTIVCLPHYINDAYFDFPRINYNHNGKLYQYIYGVEMKGPATNRKLLKVDVNTGEMTSWCEEDCFPSEAVFVARPEAQTEDDGVLLSVVLHEDVKAEPFLLVLDASNMQELARAKIGVQVHSDFHGDFFTME